MGDPVADPTVRGQALLRCLGVLGSVFPVGMAPTMAQFRAGLRGPLGKLLPADVDLAGVEDLALLDTRGDFSDEARDLCAEHLVPEAAVDGHWPWAKVATEQEERRVYEVLRRLSAVDYARARELLVDLPSGDVRELRRAWDRMWGRLDLYEPITAWSWCLVRGWWFACPVCRWPMRATESGAVVSVRCEVHVRDGLSYTCRVDTVSSKRPPLLQPSGPRATPVEGSPATPESRAVSRVVWRYVTVPGTLECDLRDHARTNGADVVMWPEKDRYDLAIALGSTVWRVDAKAWASPIALGEALQGTRPAEPGLIIVIPDYQRSSRDMLATMVALDGYRVMTADDLKKDITRAAVTAAAKRRLP